MGSVTMQDQLRAGKARRSRWCVLVDCCLGLVVVSTLLHWVASRFTVGGGSVLWRLDPFVATGWRHEFSWRYGVLCGGSLILVSLWMVLSLKPWGQTQLGRKIGAIFLIIWLANAWFLVRAEPSSGAIFYLRADDYRSAVPLVADQSTLLPPELSDLTYDGTADAYYDSSGTSLEGVYFPTDISWMGYSAGLWFSADDSGPPEQPVRYAGCLKPTKLAPGWWYCGWNSILR